MDKTLTAFPYKKHLTGDLFPIIPVALNYKKKRIEVYALVDSGATTSIFRPEVAEELGIRVEKGQEIYLSGVGGRIKGYIHRLEIETADKKFACPIIFSYEYTVSFNLLGREEFFKRFVIVFDENKKRLELQ